VDEGARIYTAWLWEKLHGRDPAPLSFTHLEVLRQFEPYDLEDLVYTWMQVAEDYLALPKARRTDTPVYEWTMLNRKTFAPAIVQVKSGIEAVDLEALAGAAPNTETILFACSGEQPVHWASTQRDPLHLAHRARRLRARTQTAAPTESSHLVRTREKLIAVQSSMSAPACLRLCGLIIML